MRARRSRAISERASVPRVRRKLSLKPRTPTSAATPTATDSTTKPNLPGAERRSRQPMAPARFQLNARLAILHPVLNCNHTRPVIGQRIFYDHSVLEDNLAVGAAGYLRIVRHQHQRRPRFAIALQQ